MQSWGCISLLGRRLLIAAINRLQKVIIVVDEEAAQDFFFFFTITNSLNQRPDSLNDERFD